MVGFFVGAFVGSPGVTVGGGVVGAFVGVPGVTVGGDVLGDTVVFCCWCRGLRVIRPEKQHYNTCRFVLVYMN